VVEKVATELLSEEANSRGLLSARQFERRQRLAAIESATIMVHRAHPTWTNGHIIARRLMDITAAIASVAKGRLVNLIKVSQMDWDLI